MKSRNKTSQYHLTSDNEIIKVCFVFLNKLDIKQRTVYYAHAGKLDGCASATTEGFVPPNCRRKNTFPNTISDDVRAFVKWHIESFPALTSHYCRKKTSRKYLDSNLNISQCLICAEVAVKKKKDETQ